MTERITYADLEAAIRDALGPDPGPEDALTMNEIIQLDRIDSTEVARRRMRWLLRELIDQGRAECVKVHRPAIDGRRALVPAYRLRRVP